MDKSLYVSMTSAQNSMHELEVITNNLANVNTVGFRADTTFLEQYKVATNGLQSRVYSKLSGTYTDFNQGPTITTDRDLDVAIKGNGFIAVQSKSGGEAYTRDGNLQLNNGVLMRASGELVLGNSGAINIPPAEKISIAGDGTISARLIGATEMVVIDRIKMTNPNVNNLQKGPDGLFRNQNGQAAPHDPTVNVVTGSLEGSNVNPIETMTRLIDLTRNYEIHTNFIKTISDDTSKANQLLELSR